MRPFAGLFRLPSTALTMANGKDYNTDNKDYDLSPDRFAHRKLGAASIKKIEQASHADLTKPKRLVKLLSTLTGALSTRLQQSSWTRRFEAYRQWLKQDLVRPLNGDDIELFSNTILLNLTPCHMITSVSCSSY